MLFSAFLLTLAAQTAFGWHVHNDTLLQYGRPEIGYWSYIATGHFWEATLENWQSEFWQMGAYLLLTAFLVQRGSPESKPVTAAHAHTGS